MKFGRLGILAIVVVLASASGALWGGTPDSKGLTPTFCRDIAPILHSQCTECHRDGEVAPFPLVNYQDAAKRAEFIAEIVSKKVMPPWRAVPDYGHFVGERRLTEDQIATFVKWAEAGAPEGDGKDLPPTPDFPTGWKLGEPDVVLECPHDVAVPADGPDIFHHFIVSAAAAEGKEIAAIEFRPGNPRVVHHAVVLQDTAGAGRNRDAQTPEPGYVTSGGVGIPLSGIMTIWAPGVAARPMPEGIAIPVAKNTDVVVQLHLHPSGKVETDRSRIGLYFAKKPATHHVLSRTLIFGPVTFALPPGAKDHVVEASMKLPVNLSITAVLPHMHLLGREMKVSATLPSGEERPLIWIKDWNFNWQDQYVYREPVDLPKGTVIRVTGIYDNSADNPSNPSSPPKRILFGEETEEEMCLAIFQSVSEDSDANKKIRDATIRTILGQINKPDVPQDVRHNIISKLREFGASEFRQIALERAAAARGQNPTQDAK